VAIKLVVGLLEIRAAHPDVIDVSVHTDHH
jgi:hypothetical protein